MSYRNDVIFRKNLCQCENYYHVINLKTLYIRESCMKSNNFY